MESRDRPIGVTILSLVAFAAALAISVFAGAVLFILAESQKPSAANDPGMLLYAWLFLLVLSAALLALAWTSFRAGLDLWNLRNRGRQLASVSMILFLLPGIGYLLLRDNWSTWAGIAICVLSVFFFTYLQLPLIRGRFETPPAK
jgi:hypothetical protein